MYEVVAVRLEPSGDGSHSHVGLVGFEAQHTPGEPLMIEIPRVLQRIAFGERFWVVVGGEKAEVSAGKCHVCGLEPYLTTAADGPETHPLLELPQK